MKPALEQSKHKQKADDGEDRAVGETDARLTPQVAPACGEPPKRRSHGHVADTICRLQGAGGQWWWHYDVRTGAVVEEYPVFAVHQDGMAPMALLAIDELTGTDHSLCIERGLQWLSGSNELNEAMIVPEAGVVWRDIHRREPGKMYRLARGMMITAGLNKAHRLAGGNVFGYVVNRECRPYHLGWILYAWSGRIPKSRGQSGKKTAEAIR